MIPNIALYNFVPHYCPFCGKGISFADHLGRNDYHAQTSHTCPACLTKYQYVRNTDLLLRTADKAGGDLHEWVEREAVDAI